MLINNKRIRHIKANSIKSLFRYISHFTSSYSYNSNVWYYWGQQGLFSQFFCRGRRMRIRPLSGRLQNLSFLSFPKWFDCSYSSYCFCLVISRSGSFQNLTFAFLSVLASIPTEIASFPSAVHATNSSSLW